MSYSSISTLVVISAGMLVFSFLLFFYNENKKVPAFYSLLHTTLQIGK